MPKVDPWAIVKYIVQGVGEDITHKRQSAGIGKWNDIVKKKKEVPKETTPKRFALSPRRAIDIKRKLAELQQTEKY